ncbi:TrkH family potassium uptake protein [Salinarimonas rosea]|uniref:TrkH family potassium uptake protein n=1 Tax=Salinarimonas rosea TaxID=552063 RepID=UPI00041E2604|nr:TrkH family potassium uptake protein [Salinarimonas rosea]
MQRTKSLGLTVPALAPVASLVGGTLLALAAAMVLPMAVDLWARNPDWRAFAVSAGLTAGAGALLVVAGRGGLRGGLTIRQAFILTPATWTAVALFAALPLYASDYAQLRDSFTNAFFESMSGLTTTGSTVIVGLDSAPPGVLLWRAILQWLGGIGIIATAIAILPALGVGGMQLFRTESSDRSEKVLPRVRDIAAAIAAVYVGLTALCAALYWLAGMTPFDAVAHALTTVSTGGYSTTDLSMGGFGPGTQWIAIAFMLAGALPFVLYIRLLRSEGAVFLDSQVRTLVLLLVCVSTLLATWLVVTHGYAPGEAARHAAFNVVSVVTTTGYASTDYLVWGNLAVGLFFALTFIGGCTGSTSGGMKIFRFEIMAQMLRAHFRRLIYPHGVFPRTYAGRPLPDDVVASVVVFFSLFFICYSLITLVLMAIGLDFVTAISASVTALANVGPGLGPIIGPAGNFAPLPDAAKWVLTFAMLLGRLELFTVLILLTPGFWRE